MNDKEANDIVDAMYKPDPHVGSGVEAISCKIE